MRGKNAAVAMDEREPRVLNLTFAGMAAQLMYRLDRVKHAARRTRVGVRKQPPVRISRQAAAES